MTADPPIALSQERFLARCRSVSTRRDPLIDIVRGIALLGILIPHYTAMAAAVGSIGGLRSPILADIAFCDEPDFFVFFSGYVNGLVGYQRAMRDGYGIATRQTLRRIIQIFRAIVFTVVLAVALSWVLIHDQRALAGLDLLPFEQNGRAALAAVATLSHSTLFINVLMMFLFLSATTPLLLWGFSRSVAMTFAFSVAVWLLVQLGPLRFTTGWGGFQGFNPFAWQLVFAMGVFLGMQRGFDTLIASLTPARLRLLLGGALFFLALRTLIRLSPAASGFLLPLAHKSTLAPLRVANFVVLAPLAMLLVAWLQRAVPVLADLLSRMGALSLEMFCVGVVISLVMIAAFLGLGGGVAAYALVLAVGLVAYLLATPAMELVS